jgi:uncharacterized protein YhjY with autotransporter beta-barrel domain
MLASFPARADLDDIEFLNPIERAAARANQAVFEQLTSGPNPVCSEEIRTPTGSCTGTLFETFSNVRELVHTANELTDSGPTTFSLNVDQESLGFALRWTAAEELAAQGSSATQFSTNQLNSLASRIAALRFGARGLRSAYKASGSDGLYASEVRPLGGGASSDSESDSIVRRWSAFVDGSYGYGRKDDTSDPFNPAGSQGAEDAFDFDGQEVSAGVDYRLRDDLVLGALLGYTDRSVDFDSSVSIVDGTIESKGQSLIFYALWENDRFYLSGSLGAQWLEYDLVRRITYPSLNPLVASIDVTTTSDTDSNAIIATLNGGMPFNFGALGVEPFLKAEYQDLSIDDFTESGSSGFEFNYGKQDIKSLDLAGGFKIQYALTPSFGVIVPYLRGEYHKELENESRNISALYAGLPTAARTSTEDFSLATDEPDDEFLIAAGGFSVVLKNGLQGFLQYQQVFDLDTFDDRAITGGIRLEF